MKMRKATLQDVEAIQKLVNSFAKKDLMLPRSLNVIYENIRDFWIIEDKGEVAACCALHPMWESMAEIKSLAVREDYQKRNLGKKLIEACIDESEGLKVNTIFALTFVPDFFKKNGFKRGDKSTMPHKIWSECINCPHFPDCDEILMVREL